MSSTAVEEPLSVTRFREYLRINTMQPEPDYPAAMEWLTKYAGELGLPSRVIEPYPKRPFCIMTWEGRDPKLPTLFLYSHTDVVPVFPDKWSHPPFSAHKDEEGRIFARGAQDMKCVGIQYMEAIRELMASGYKPLRTVHIVWGPDEEITGKLGFAKFIHTEERKALNIGFALDEGLASPDDSYVVFPGERCMWWFKVTCTGNPGHGSKFIPGTAAEKLHKVMTAFLGFREEQKAKLEGDPSLSIGDVISLNMTKLEGLLRKDTFAGGVQLNVVPAELSAYFDVRVPPTVDDKALVAQFESFCAAAGEGVSIEWINHYFTRKIADTTDASPWWRAFKGTMDKLGLKIKKEIFTGGTDARFLRMEGIEAIGFSPMNNTPILLHDHDEFLKESTFLRGIQIYKELLPSLADVPPQ